MRFAGEPYQRISGLLSAFGLFPSRYPVYFWEQLTPEILHKSLILLERVKGIEPSSSAWKAVALPLSYTRGTGSNPRSISTGSGRA